MAQCPNLVAVNGLGHGVDYITKEEGKLKPDVQILRVVDTLMAERMAYWNLWAIINCQVPCERGAKACAGGASSLTLSARKTYRLLDDGAHHITH